jgi:hypothetical protein
MSRELVRLKDRYPGTSRMTRWRIKKQPGFPDSIEINGTEYHYSDELDAYEESRRRLTPSSKRRVAETKSTTLED